MAFTRLPKAGNIKAMRKELLLILIGFLPCPAYSQQAIKEPKPANLTIPSRIAWSGVFSTIPPRNARDGMVEFVIADGNKWRMEAVESGNGRLLVAVFDGHAFACNFPKLTLEKVDPITPMRGLFAGMTSSNYQGIEVIEGEQCWLFRETNANQAASVWVSTLTRTINRFSFPRQSATGNFVQKEKFQVLPTSILDRRINSSTSII
jgi:hypothetical protein